MKSNIFYIVLFIIVSLYLVIRISNSNNISTIDSNVTELELIVNDYDINNDKLTMELCNSNECVIGTYYFKDINKIKTIKYGTVLLVRGKLNEPINNTVPNSFNYKNYLNNKDIYYLFNISNIEIISNEVNIIYKIRNFIRDRSDNIDNKGYIRSFILGNKDNIDDNQYNTYQVIGITHLFALSGMHISVIVLLLDKLLSKLGNKRYIIIDIILFIYGIILYFPASLKRTIIFYIINSLNKIFKLDISSIKVLFITFILLVINNYKIIYDIGFIYSFVTVGGILISKRYITSSIKLSIIAFLFSAPISLYYFYSINILSILFNILYIFYISYIVYPLSIIVFIIPKLYFIYSFFIEIMIIVSNYLSKIDIFIIYMDLNVIEVLIYYFILIYYIYYKNKINIFILSLILIIDYIIPYFDSNSYVYFFDVLQGDSSLIISPYRKDIILIDTGGMEGKNVSSNVISFIKSKGIKRINTIILSHGDYDHMGDVYNYINNFKIDKIIFNNDSYNTLELELIKVLDKNNIKYYKNINNINNLYFLNKDIYDNENDNSNIILTSIYDTKILYMGDVSTNVEVSLIDKYKLDNIDILKVGHHGSKSSSDINFINEINNTYSIISVGRNNRYNHPSDIVLDNLSNTKILRTDIDGTITVIINDDKLIVEKCGT